MLNNKSITKESFLENLKKRLLLINNESFFFGLLVMIFVLFVYGSYFARSLLKFIGVNNQRFMMLKSGFNSDQFNNSGFSKDNVVG